MCELNVYKRNQGKNGHKKKILRVIIGELVTETLNRCRTALL